MNENGLKQADKAFSEQVSSQVTRITSELNRLETLLSAGMVDRQVLTEFRDAVNRVRQTGWQVQTWLEGDSRALRALLIEDRVRVATRLTNQLASELETTTKGFAGLAELKQAVRKLDAVLPETELEKAS
jgi:phage-related protein